LLGHGGEPQPIELDGGRELLLVGPGVAAEPVRVVALHEVDTLQKLVLIDWAILQNHEVVRQCLRVHVGLGDELEEFYRGRMNAVLWNRVVREGLRHQPPVGLRARAGIEDRRRHARQIPGADRSGWRVEYGLALPPLAETFEVRHEEQPVASVEELRNRHWTVEFEAVLIPPERALGRAQSRECVLLRVERAVAQKFERRAVKGIAARFRRYVDLAEAASELSGIDPLTDERCSYNVMIEYVTIKKLKG